jgi:hypothetical protein
MVQWGDEEWKWEMGERLGHVMKVGRLFGRMVEVPTFGFY